MDVGLDRSSKLWKVTKALWTHSGVFNALHGAGEAIRGNINSFLDQGGDAVSFLLRSRQVCIVLTSHD